MNGRIWIFSIIMGIIALIVVIITWGTGIYLILLGLSILNFILGIWNYKQKERDSKLPTDK